MKKRVLAVLLAFAMLCTLSLGFVSVQAATSEVIAEDFASMPVSDNYAATAGVAQLADGKLVIDTTGMSGEAFGGVTLLGQKVTEFVLEFDIHNECEGTNTFALVTGMADEHLPSSEDWNASALIFGTADSMSVNNTAGPWQRYSWQKVPADARVRVTVKTDTFTIEHKVGDGEWTAIKKQFEVALAPTEGYLGLVVNGSGKVSVDNLVLTVGESAVFSDDFSLGSGFAATPGAVSVAEQKLVIDTTKLGDNAFGGVTLTSRLVSDFVMEFDLHNECDGANTFALVTGKADAAAPVLEDWNASALIFGTADSMSVNNTAGPWQRYSWQKVPADARVRVTVKTDAFTIEHKVGDGEWTAIKKQFEVALSPAEGYLALVINGSGKVTVDNISVIAEGEPAVPETPSETPSEIPSENPSETPSTEEPSEPEVAGEGYLWEDDFERDELGDLYTVTAAGAKIVDGRLQFDNTTTDATGVFLKTAKLGNKFAVSFDVNMQEGSACPAFLFGMENQAKPIMYWDASVDRFSLYMQKYMLGRAGEQMDYVPNSGTDTDIVASPEAPWKENCAVFNKDVDEYVNMMLVFDEEDGENVLRVYYKLNTEPDSELMILRSTWKGIAPEGYVGLVAQGHLSANFWVDNLKITTTLPEIVEPEPETPETPETSETAPDTGVASGSAAALAMTLLCGGAILCFRKRK